MDKMELKALGKINLGLDVLGRRENGYHDVRMVMQTVYLYDQIVITKTKQPGVKAETNLFYLPVDENNLACRAAKMLIDEFNITEGVHISMDKKIPVSAGMAGGSIFAGIFSEPYDIKDIHTKAGILITMIPAALIILLIKSPFDGLVYSQMLLGIQLPITIFTQIYLTSSKKVMGKYANSSVLKIVLWIVALIVTALNIGLFISML